MTLEDSLEGDQKGAPTDEEKGESSVPSLFEGAGELKAELAAAEGGTTQVVPTTEESIGPVEPAQGTCGKFFAVKTSIGHERIAADMIAHRVKVTGEDVYAILSPQNLRGYVLVEAADEERLRHMLKGVRRVHNVVGGVTSLQEIDHYLTPKPVVSGIVEGDIIELIAGPFKGEKARVKQIDEGKEEITVELIESVIPIPITVRGDHVRVIEKGGDESPSSGTNRRER